MTELYDCAAKPKIHSEESSIFSTDIFQYRLEKHFSNLAGDLSVLLIKGTFSFWYQNNLKNLKVPLRLVP